MTKGRREQGHLMILLVVAIAILMIFSTVAARSWAEVVRRDREAEMMFRAQEIVRAISKYRKANGRLPNTLDELMEPGPKGQYFLRKLYDDPLVKDGEWGKLYAAPGGGVLDPNNPGLEVAAPEIGQSSLTATRQQDALTPGLAGRQGTGLPIIGVKSLAEDRAFRVYKGQREYSLWQFTLYDLEPAGAGGAPPGGEITETGNAPGAKN